MAIQENVSPLLEAQKAIEYGLYSRAEGILNSILEKSPKNLAAMRLYSLLYQRLNKPFEGIAILQKVLELSKNDIESHLLISQLYKAIGDAESSIKHAEEVLKVNPNHSKALGWIGGIHASRHEFKLAELYLRKSVAIDPLRWDSQFILGTVCQRTGKFSEAIEIYEVIYKKSELPVQALTKLMSTYREMGDEPGVKKLNERAERDFSTSKAQVHAFCQYLWADEFIDYAEIWVKKGLEMMPNDPVLLATLGAIQQRLGEFEEAVITLEEAAKNSTQPAQALYELVYSKKINENDLPYEKRLKELLRNPQMKVGEQSKIHYALAKIYDDLKEYEKAAPHYREANRLQMLLMGNPVRPIKPREEIDFAKRKFTKEFFEKNKVLGSDSKKPIFVIGMIRSGTTLTEQIISSHPDVAAAGELQYLLNRISLTFDVNENLMYDKLEETRDGLLHVLASHGGSSPRVTDKMPLNYQLLGLIYLLFPKAKIVHCKREPRDNALSIYMTPYVKPVNFAHEPSYILHFYHEYCRLMDHWKSVMPKDYIFDLQYEELVANKAEKTKELMDFLELPWNETVLHHEENGRAILTPSTWQAKQPIYNTSVAKWKRYKDYLPEFASCEV